MIKKAALLWRGRLIALSRRLTCMAGPSWAWPTATFLREGLRSRGPVYWDFLGYLQDISPRDPSRSHPVDAHHTLEAFVQRVPLSSSSEICSVKKYYVSRGSFVIILLSAKGCVSRIHEIRNVFVAENVYFSEYIGPYKSFTKFVMPLYGSVCRRGA